MGTVEYVEALSNLIDDKSSLFKVHEPKVSYYDCYYTILISTDTFFAGDVIHFFTIDSCEIAEVRLLIDDNEIHSSVFDYESNVSFEYTQPINVISCDLSEIKLKVKAKLPPIVHTYYSLVPDRRPYYRKYLQGNPGYLNGYFGKIYNGAEFSR